MNKQNAASFSENFAIFQLRHAHVRKDTRLSPAFPYWKRRKAGRGLGTRLGCLNCPEIFNMQIWAGRLNQKCTHPSCIQCQNTSPHDAVFATVSVEEVQRYAGKGQLWHGITPAGLCTQLHLWANKNSSIFNYHSFMKERLGQSTLQVYPKWGVGAFSSVSTFNHEGAPMSCLQRLDALEASNWRSSNKQRNHQWL